MLELGPPKFLVRMGEAISKKSPSFILVVSLTAFLVFILISSTIVNTLGDAAKKASGIQVDEAGLYGEGFSDRYNKADGATYQALVHLGLSKVNFISNYKKAKQENGRQYEYTFLEMWVKNDFSFRSGLEMFLKLISQRVKGVEVEPTLVDAKTYTISVRIDGIETHKVIFSKTGVEVEDDAAALAMLDIEKKLPQASYTGPAKIAIIIDDIGHKIEVEQQFLTLPEKVTFAVLPYSPQGANFAERAHKLGHEIMLHMPMQPKAYPQIRPGKGGLLLNMSNEALITALNQNLALVPHISGINNHMGSAFTSSTEKMHVVLSGLLGRGLYFIDSRTVGSAKGYEVAKDLGIPASYRNVFLDHDPRPENISRQFDLMVRLAKKRGLAVAIGHPHTATLMVLKRRLPELRRQNIIVVPPSKIVK